LIKKIWRNNLKGFSLIELMVVVVILSLIVLGLVTFFTGGIGAGNSSITISYPNTPDTFTKDQVTYKLSADNKLQRETDGGTNTLLNDVIALSFTPLDLSNIRILLKVDMDNDTKPDISLNTEVNLRNYYL